MLGLQPVAEVLITANQDPKLKKTSSNGKYRQAPLEVKQTYKTISKKWPTALGHLADVEILWLMSEKVRNCAHYQLKIVDELHSILTKYQLIVIVNELHWYRSNELGRQAIIYDSLCSVEVDENGAIFLDKQTVSFNPATVQRYGVDWDGELKDAIASVQQLDLGLFAQQMAE